MSMRNCGFTAAVFLALILLVQPTMAQQKPIQLALVTPIQIVPDNYGISGVRLSLLYGRNTNVSGIDLGLVNHCTSGRSEGLQWGLVGLVDADFTGFQAAGANITQKNFEGFQWGFVNYAGHCSGFQLGFVNYAMTMKGLQIGLVNIIRQGGQFPVFPIVNWSF